MTTTNTVTESKSQYCGKCGQPKEVNVSEWVSGLNSKTFQFQYTIKLLLHAGKLAN